MKKLKLIGLLAAILALAFTFAACNNGAGGGATGVGDYDDMVITGKNAKNETVITRFSTDRKIERVALTQLETGDRYVMTVAGNEVSRGTIAVSNGIYVTFRPTSGAEFSGVVSGGSLSSLSGAGMPGELAGFKTTKPASGGGGGYSPTPPVFVSITNITIANANAENGVTTTLSATIEPSTATNKTIVWTIKEINDVVFDPVELVVESVLTGGAFKATGDGTGDMGTFLVTATVADGKETDGVKEPYTKDFTINVGPFVPLTSLTVTTDKGIATKQLTLGVEYNPTGATTKTPVIWTVVAAGGTGVTTIPNTGIITPTGAGTLQVTAKVELAGEDVGDGRPTITSATKDIVISAPITILAIPGVTVPVAGAEPVETIESAQYNGVITWDGTLNGDDEFDFATVYTAEIVLTAKAGFTVEAVAENSFTVAGATTVTNPAYDSGTTITVTAVFPETEADPGP